MFTSTMRGCLCVVAFGWGIIAADLVRGADINEQRPADMRAYLEQKLKEPTNIDALDEPLGDVIQQLEALHAIDIELDAREIEFAGVSGDTLVTRAIRGATLESALNLILREFDLTYLIRDEVLLITTQSEADSYVETRIYPVGELLANEASACDKGFDPLIKVLTTTIEPNTWNRVGGLAEVTPMPSARSLVVLQTQQAHRKIERLLSDIRTVMKQQLATTPQSEASVNSSVQADATEPPQNSTAAEASSGVATAKAPFIAAPTANGPEGPYSVK